MRFTVRVKKGKPVTKEKMDQRKRKAKTETNKSRTREGNNDETILKTYKQRTTLGTAIQLWAMIEQNRIVFHGAGKVIRRGRKVFIIESFQSSKDRTRCANQRKQPHLDP